MSLYSALRSSVSSIQANSDRVGMISNNIANSNSVGYKRVNADFSSFVSENFENTNFSAGGVRANASREINTQGEVAATGNATDMAISGNGYFAVTKYLSPDDNEGWMANSEILFTRRGDFSQDVNGNLQNSDGHYLLAWPQDASTSGIMDSSSLDDFRAINVGSQRVEPIASTELKVGVNVIPETLVGEDFSIQYALLDGKGNPNPVELTFQKIPPEINTLHFSAVGSPALDKTVATSVPNGWRVYANFTDSDEVGFRQFDATGTDTGIASGQDVPIADLIFDNTGKLSNVSLPGAMSFFRQTELPINDGTVQETGADSTRPINLSSITATGQEQMRRVLIESGISETALPAIFSVGQLLNAIEVLDTVEHPGAMPQIMQIANSNGTPFENSTGRQAAGYALLNGSITDMTQYWPADDVPGEFARGMNGGDKYMVSRLIDGETSELVEPLVDANNLPLNLPAFSSHSFNKIALAVDYDGGGAASDEDIFMTLDFGSMNLSSLTAGGSFNRSSVSVPISSNIGTGEDGVTQFSDNISTIRNLENNGRASSLLRNVNISTEGLVTGQFYNGQQRPLGQVALVVFANPNALLPAEGLSFSRNDDTGKPLVRLANSSEAGRIVSNSTESSSVDLAQEFADMIVSQRGFSASAKVVSTTQAMIEELSQRL